MNRRTSLVLAAIAIAIAACAPPPPQAPVTAPQQPNAPLLRYLIDPRIGFNRAVPQALDKRFDAGWRLVLAGDFAGAHKRIDDIVSRDPNYLPARLAEAAMAILGNRPETARTIVDRALVADPRYTAARAYDAELSLLEGRPQRAYQIYRELASMTNAPPTAVERAGELGKQMFEQYFTAAQSAAPEESIGLLRQALAIEPSARPPRMLLVQRLIALRRFDEAHTEIQPLLSTDADSNDVQEALAEIDAGSGNYQAAIVRYERLARRTKEQRYVNRLNDLKQQFAAANMPPQYQRAFESDSITRADLAVLMYWKVASIRFAQNLGVPPIAIDIGEIPGRDEVIRAIALGIYTVDPVTRRVGPLSPVNAGSLARVAARVLILRGASCIKNAQSAPTDQERAQNALAACGITDPTTAGADLPVSGRQAAAVMEQVDAALSR